MNVPADNGYISDFLIHWTGKQGDTEGARILSIISQTRQLLLSDNDLHTPDISHKIRAKMVCFTDVPLRHSHEHCAKYGKFGIAFKKRNLMNVGAQPVFYASHACKRDLNAIFAFLQDPGLQTTLDSDVLKALHRHFFFIQRLSDGPADARNTFYYEREWRLGEQTLVPAAVRQQDNPKYRSQCAGYPPYTGRLVENDEKSYFEFDQNDVAFLIAPRNLQSGVVNPHGFAIEPYEDLVVRDGTT